MEDFGNPIAVGELASARPDAPTLLLYGHYDVQGPGELHLWRSDPFEPVIRDGRVWARGASDDKGNVFPAIYAACELARTGRLPLNVRVVIEGEEETGSQGMRDWLAMDARGADFALVLDAAMADADTPALTCGLRGLATAEVKVRTAEQALHSGMYGGVVLNAAHVLQGMLEAVMPDREGRPPDLLRTGIARPSTRELDSWGRLRSGTDVVQEAGGRPVSSDAVDAYYERTGADISVDVNEIRSGEPRSIVPSTARATVSARPAPGQDAFEIGERIEALLRNAAPTGADVDIAVTSAEPALVDVAAPAMQAAAAALRRACGKQPELIRMGGSIPVVAALIDAGITPIVTGFALPSDRVHAPNESFRIEALGLGLASAHELFVGLGALQPADAGA